VGLVGCALLSACGGGGSGGAPPDAYPTPILVSSTLAFSALETSETHACGTSPLGEVTCWGKDGHGELGASGPLGQCDLPGVELVPCTAAPQPVAGLPALVSLGAATEPGRTCGLTSGGQAWCWGYGLGGQLGDGQRASSAVPVAVAGGLSLALLRLSSTGLASCGLTASGEGWCWGVNDQALFGDGLAPAVAPTPVRVDWGRVFTTLDLGEAHGCGLATAGDAWCWGGNWYGQLGTGEAGGLGGLAQAAAPVAVAGDHAFVAIATGSDHTCALDGAGAAWCWGLWDGQYQPTPLAVPGGLHFASLAAGYLHTCALTALGEGWCWGPNDGGQLGDGTRRTSYQPVRVATDLPLARLSHRPTCALTTTGQALCWGSDSYGQVGRVSPYQR